MENASIFFLSFEYATTIAGHISPRQRHTCIVVLRQKDSRRSRGPVTRLGPVSLTLHPGQWPPEE